MLSSDLRLCFPVFALPIDCFFLRDLLEGGLKSSLPSMSSSSAKSNSSTIFGDFGGVLERLLRSPRADEVEPFLAGFDPDPNLI